MIEFDKMEMPAAIIKQFDLKTVRLIGNEEGFYSALHEALEGHSISEEEYADAVFLSEYEDNPAEAIQEAFECVNANGFLFGTDYDHNHVEVQRSVAALFPLYATSVGPGGVWAVRKGG